MPKLYFPAATTAIVSVTNVAEWVIKRNIGRGAKCRIQSGVDVVRTGRIRSVPPDQIELKIKSVGSVRSRLYLRPRNLKLASDVTVKSFVATIPPAPPEGTLYRASIRSLLTNSTPPAMNGSRIVKGDLTPLCFKLTGQKLTGLTAELILKRKDLTGAAPIVKSGSAIHQTAPSLDPETNTEVMMGQLAIEPADTASLPEQEVEFAYQLKLTDGVGRVYTLETGFFTVYPAL